MGVIIIKKKKKPVYCMQVYAYRLDKYVMYAISLWLFEMHCTLLFIIFSFQIFNVCL